MPRLPQVEHNTNMQRSVCICCLQVALSVPRWQFDSGCNLFIVQQVQETVQLSIAVCLLAEPKLPNFEANFRQLLQGSRFNRPNEAIVDMIVRRLAARMIACSSVNQAADLYEDASLLPGASTVTHLMTQHDLRVNGPLYPRCEGRQNKFQHLVAWTCKRLTDLHLTLDYLYRGEDGPSCLLTAMHASGRPCIVKLLDTRVSLDSSEQPGGAEAAAVRLVCDTAAVEEAVPVVKAEVITLHLSANHHSTGHGPGKYAAIVMPQYCGSVATQVQMSEAAIEAGAQRMLRALEYVHSKGLVHMDVKVQNLLPHHVKVSMTLTHAFAWPCRKFQYVACCMSCRAITYLWTWPGTGGLVI